MANDLTAVMGKILAHSLPILREQCILSRLVNNDYSTEAREKGDTIDVPISDAATVSDVTPSNTDPAPSEVAPTKVQISLNKWKKSNFKMTDKDKLEVSEKTGYLPRKVEEALKALANQVNNDLYSAYKGVYGFAGTPGTTPFTTDEQEAIDARKVLNNQLAPMNPRRIILDPDAEAKALKVPALADMDKVGQNNARIEGQIGRRLGFDWFMDQLVPRHTSGTLTGTIVVSGAHTEGDESILLATDAAEAIALKEGDIITFATHAQTYVVTADLTVGASSTGTLNIKPGLTEDVAGTTQIAVKASHRVNLAFHPDAFALAVRTALDDTSEDSGARTMVMPDPLTGLPLRLEVRRQHKQTVWEFDILYGFKCVRPELAARIAGA
jgi:hypothetical protein